MKGSVTTWFCLALGLLLMALADGYRVGIGKADITGPLAGVAMMGYAKDGQVNAGLLNRQYTRVFVIYPDGITDAAKAVVIVHTDLHSVPVRLRQEVVEKLQTFGISAANVMIHGQHTHSGAAAFHPSLLYNYPSFEYRESHLGYLVKQIVVAFQTAFNSQNQFAANLFTTKKKLLGCGRNRSPLPFNNNPSSELQEFLSEMGEQKNSKMTIIRIVAASSGVTKGIMSFFAIHPTNLDNENTLVSSDNKGYAEYVLETKYKSQGLIAAFFNADHADISPNMVDVSSDLFGGSGEDDVESAEIMGAMQAGVVDPLIAHGDSSETQLTGAIGGGMKYYNFSDAGCRPELGVSFLAGTEDGRGLFLIQEGWNQTVVDANAWLQFVNTIGRPVASLILSNPSSPDDDSAYAYTFGTGTRTDPVANCVYPKVSIIKTDAENQFLPEVLPIQVMRLGQLFLGATSFEITSISGFRLRKMLMAKAASVVSNPIVEVVGMTNGYSSYLATPEEYDFQHYEGAFTVFGRHQLELVKTQMSAAFDLIGTASRTEKAMIQAAVYPGVTIAKKSDLPADIIIGTPEEVWFATGVGVVITDHNLGSSVIDVSSYTYDDYIQVVFGCTSMEDNQQLISSFCTLEKLNVASNAYESILTDSDWAIRLAYQRSWGDKCTCTWRPVTTLKVMPIAAGTYRLTFNGVEDDGASGDYYSVSSSTFRLSAVTPTPAPTTASLVAADTSSVLMLPATAVASVIPLVIIGVLVGFLLARYTKPKVDHDAIEVKSTMTIATLENLNERPGNEFESGSADIEAVRDVLVMVEHAAKNMTNKSPSVAESSDAVVEPKHYSISITKKLSDAAISL